MAGPANTLFAIAAEGIAAVGSRTRELTQEEYDWANGEVFLGSLPPRDKIVHTDTIGGGNRAFTFPRFDGKITLNMGPDGWPEPRNYHVGYSKGDRYPGQAVKYGEVLTMPASTSRCWQTRWPARCAKRPAIALTSTVPPTPTTRRSTWNSRPRSSAIGSPARSRTGVTKPAHPRTSTAPISGTSTITCGSGGFDQCGIARTPNQVSFGVPQGAPPRR
jgi:hypothetical protein